MVSLSCSVEETVPGALRPGPAFADRHAAGTSRGFSGSLALAMATAPAGWFAGILWCERDDETEGISAHFLRRTATAEFAISTRIFCWFLLDMPGPSLASIWLPENKRRAAETGGVTNNPILGVVKRDEVTVLPHLARSQFYPALRNGRWQFRRQQDQNVWPFTEFNPKSARRNTKSAATGARFMMRAPADSG